MKLTIKERRSIKPMKKAIVVVLAVLMFAVCLVPTSAFVYNPELNVPKATTAPTVDGTVGDDEYTFVIDYNKDWSIWGITGEEYVDAAADYDITCYFAWDDDAFYYAVTAKSPVGGRTYNNKDWSTTAPFIFQRLSVMTGMLFDTPDNVLFYSEDNWTWSDSYNSSWTREWTISMDADGTQLSTNHFGSVVSHADYEFKVATVDGYEVYEQKIPWAAINSVVDGVEHNVNNTVGGRVGIGATIVVKEQVPGVSDPYATTEGVEVGFGGKLGGDSKFQAYAEVVLAEAGEQVVYTVKEDSGDESTGTETPDTGDSFAFFAIFGVVALAAAVVVVKKARR